MKLPLILLLVALPELTGAQPSRKPANKQSEPVTINIGENDVRTSQPSQVSAAAADDRVTRFRIEIVKEIESAKSSARLATTPDDALPHHIKAAFLEHVLDAYVNAQYAWVTMPKDLFQEIGKSRLPADLEKLERGLAESADIFEKIVSRISASPEYIADELIDHKYEVATITAKLPTILKSSPLPVLRIRYQTMAVAARACKTFTAEARKTWGKWVVEEGNFGLSEKLTPAERKRLEDAAVEARETLNRAKAAQ